MRLNAQQLERYNQRLAMANAIQKIPPDFQPKQHARYPEDNSHEFERWFRDNTSMDELVNKSRTYLPIFWTAYWCNNGYGRKEKNKNRLQRFVDTIPRTKKYFTICQYDDGCMVDFKDLDIKIFGMSGGRIDYPIPLLCMPHKFEFPGIEKDIFCSFVGGDTHPIRRELVKQLEGKEGYYVTMKKHTLQDYCKILARSVFALCPRGYGKSSFRISEAIHYGAIPVYVSDEFIMPYNLGFCGEICETKDLSNIHYQLGHRLKMGREFPLNIREKELFTYQGCKQKILENI